MNIKFTGIQNKKRYVPLIYIVSVLGAVIIAQEFGETIVDKIVIGAVIFGLIAAIAFWKLTWKVMPKIKK